MGGSLNVLYYKVLFCNAVIFLIIWTLLGYPQISLLSYNLNEQVQHSSFTKHGLQKNNTVTVLVNSYYQTKST